MAERRRASGKRRRTSRAQEDDRPRGYEPTRMRRLWQDIDQSRDKLGLGNAAGTNGASSTWDAWTGWASDIVGNAGAQIGTLSGQVGSVLDQLPGSGACRAVGEGAVTIARQLPVVGSVVDAIESVLPAPTDTPSKSGKSPKR